VKSYLTGVLVKHWTELLNAGKPFDEHAHWSFRAGFDPETRDLTIGNYRTNIDKENPELLIRLVAQLSQVRNDIMPIVKRRAEEGKQPAGERKLQSPYDLDMLRREGLHDFADELEAELRAAQFGPRRASDPGSENEDGQKAD